MHIETDTLGDAVILRPVGRLDGATSPELEKLVCERIEGGARHIVFDFGELAYISSAGLRVVLIAGKKMREVEGRFALARLQVNVREVFAMSGFLSLFPVVDTVAHAVE